MSVTYMVCCLLFNAFCLSHCIGSMIKAYKQQGYYRMGVLYRIIDIFLISFVFRYDALNTYSFMKQNNN